MNHDHGELHVGDHDYRAYVGAPDRYDLIGALQFSLLTALGLRETHSVLDIGCGSLRLGRLLIPYLRPHRYFGLEPNSWLVEDGLAAETGEDLRSARQPEFSDRSDFRFDEGSKFDFLIAQSVLSHTGTKDLTRCFEGARAAMTSGSLFVATWFIGEPDHPNSPWVYPEFVYYSWDRMCREASAVGLVGVKLDWPHPAGQSWAVFSSPAAAKQLSRVRAPYSVLPDWLQPPSNAALDAEHLRRHAGLEGHSTRNDSGNP